MRVIRENYHILNKKLALTYLQYQIELLNYKLQKLKLGAIAFDIKEIAMAEIVIWQDVEIRYIRQDTTRDDELKIENRLKALNWQWDFKNVAAFLIVFTFLSLFLYSCFLVWYREKFPSFAFRNEKIDGLLKFTFDMVFTMFGISFFKNSLIYNTWISETLLEFCVFSSFFS